MTDRIDLRQKFEFTPKQKEPMTSGAQHKLLYGGIRSGKTQGALMYGIHAFTLKYSFCDILILRRNLKEAESGVILDFKTLVPPELYTWNDAKKVATFKNGSRVVFGHCLAAGTLITCQRGLVPIEDVIPGDQVLTRRGYRPVTNQWCSGIKKTMKLGSLNITPEHRVLINGRMKPVGEVSCDDQLLIHKPSYLKALSIVGTRAQNGGRIESIFLATSKSVENGHRSDSTPLFGKTHTVPSPSVAKSTMWMETRSTTTSQISLPSQSPTIESTINPDRPSMPFPAQFAKRFFKPNIPISAELVPTPVEQLGWSEDLGDPVPVYDLTVWGEHEFFANGILVSNCQNNTMQDIEQYLGQAFVFILVDECGQFSPDAWELLAMRNTVNAGCQPDDQGNLPVPEIWGLSNPVGPFWDYYDTMFLQKRPWLLDDDDNKAHRDEHGYWWVMEGNEPRCVYDPNDYYHCQSTVFDNQYMILRDPNLIPRLNALPAHKRNRMLLGLADKGKDTYFSCFDPSVHVVNLKEDPDGIIWQEWQPVWLGWDWGMGHWNTVYFFTKALVKVTGGDYRMKTVCFKEIVTRQKDMQQMVSIVTRASTHPNGCSLLKGGGCGTHDAKKGVFCNIKVSAIYFSHEKFNRSMEAHGPDVEFSRLLVLGGLIAVTKSVHAPGSRKASAIHMYQGFSRGRLVILNVCPEIIMTLPRLQTDQDDPNDVLKAKGVSKSDDCFDGFRYGYYGEPNALGEPRAVGEARKADAIKDPFARRMYLYKKAREQDAQANRQSTKTPTWLDRL